MALIRNIIFVLILPFILSCNGIPSRVKKALDKAGNNKRELLKVINHYKKLKDQEKLKATYFLLENMPYNYSYKGKLLDIYYTYFTEATIDNPAKHDSIFYSYAKKYGLLDKSKLIKVTDIRAVNSELLIHTIDQAFKVRREQPWGKKIDFHIFCEYILPYRVEDERPGYWRDSLYAECNPLLDSVRQNNGNIADACTKVNVMLKKYVKGIAYNIGYFPSFSPDEIKKIGYITCREQADLAAYAMRSVGIPVSIDYTPQWPFRSMGHTWNAVFDEENKATRFMGTESGPREPHKDDWKKAKVYRKTFSVNAKSLAEIKKRNDLIPFQLSDPHIIDVTDEYAPVKDISVKIKENLYSAKEKYVYICVFDNQNWVPIHWAKNKRKEVKFDKMGTDIAYILMYYHREKLIPASSPFILTKDGEINYLVPDNSKSLNVNLTRKYPLTEHIYDSRIVGAKFEASNKPDFSDADTLYTVKEFPGPFYQKVNISAVKKYRYARYITYKQGFANIAELEFYDDQGKELQGKITGTPGSWLGKNNTKDKAFDKNVLTFFDAPVADSASVGLDFGVAKNIATIRFLARNDGNSIEKSDVYELVYWNDGWISCGTKVAKSDSITFGPLPSGALYLLHDLTKGSEERIFTYKDNKQAWW